ncbi:pathogenesis-related thaumatin-like protein 3.2 [Salvia splendens]|uniref:pathogenesis-related thaumatin-like protein 3.2 n=1 Tax=Salvia splendens TaxID=180675 RepID=UPI001C271AD8|nr:pathogenesis-related thaumatin-like protein 3.2 [Salvia splendens]
MHCSEDPSGNFSCVTGDCGSGKVECADSVTAAIPVTLAEIALDSFNGMDVYDLSLVKGYNLPILVAPPQIAARRSASKDTQQEHTSLNIHNNFCNQDDVERENACNACSDVSSSHRNSCSTMEVGSVGRVSFLIENDQTDQPPKHAREERSEQVIFLLRSASSCVEVKKTNGFWIEFAMT